MLNLHHGTTLLCFIFFIVTTEQSYGAVEDGGRDISKPGFVSIWFVIRRRFG